MATCLEAALRYARRGWSVFPLNGKHPYPGTHGYKDATTNTKQIRRWWKQWPEANVGIACNSQTGPIVVDIDGDNGHVFLDALPIPLTRAATSGRSWKRHLYFAPHLTSEAIPRIIKPFTTDGKPKKQDKSNEVKIDILGDGGYVVAPPSKHPDTGRTYKWVHRTSLASFPDCLMEQLQARIKHVRKSNAAPLPKIIGEGERDALLTSLAGTMRRRGASEEAILAALREENATRVQPPLDDKQLMKIARSISKKAPAPVLENLTDLGNARRFIERHAEEVRAVMANRRPWMIWDGTRWKVDDTGEVERMAKGTVRAMYPEASAITDDEVRDKLLTHASKSESAGRIRAMLELAATEPELTTTTDDYDANPWLLNVQNGTVDLKSGKLLPHDRENLITRMVPVTYDPSASAPRWELFLSQVFDGDAELVEFTRRAIGYSLTGDTREQCLFFCYGQGANGKTKFVETLRALLGDYARQSDFASFMSRNSDGPRTDLARMRGARLVTASEADDSRGFDGRVVKMLTGGDTIVARKLYESETEFTPQHKLWLAANHKPVVKEQTEGFWRRIRLIPFTVTFKKGQRDPNIGRKLIKELPGILNWAIAGCVQWRSEGLLEPSAVRKATRNYREENDLLGEFIAHCCKLSESGWTPTTDLYRRFVDWWQETRGARSQPISVQWFGRMLGERQELKYTKVKFIRGWSGISIRRHVEVR